MEGKAHSTAQEEAQLSMSIVMAMMKDAFRVIPPNLKAHLLAHLTLLAAIKEGEETYIKLQKALALEVGTDADSDECRKALLAAALKHGVPRAVILAQDIYCNLRNLATTNLKDACHRLHLWFLLKKNKVLFSKATILELGPRFMSIYIHTLAIERRIYYDDVEGLTAEWLEMTSTVILRKKYGANNKREGCYSSKLRALEEVAWVISPFDDDLKGAETDTKIHPAGFPLTVHLFSTIPVAVHAAGGSDDDGPLDFGVRLYMRSF